MSSRNKIEDVIKQIRKYKKEHGVYPKGNFDTSKGTGLTESGALLKRNNGKIRIS